jgi:hypothetical protein
MALLIPEGARLLHIGPAKTGTTTLQSGFHHNRAAIAEHGVLYAGPGRQARSAASAVALGRPIFGRPRRSMAKWDELVEEVQTSTAKRIVISSETFAHCDDAAADRVVEAFDPEKLRIAITMRPLADMLPSAWQQYVQTSSQLSYEAWLQAVLVDDLDGEKTTPSFWRRMRLDRIAERWGSRLGYDRITIVSLAEQEREYVLRVFEEMVGLPAGTLVPDPTEANFSLPYPVAESIRRFNMLYKAQDGGWSIDEHARLIELGSVDLIKKRGPGVLERYPIGTPQWAIDRSAEIVGDINGRLRELGVNVAGDLDALTRSPKPAVSDEPPGELRVDDVGSLLYAMMQAAKAEGRREARLEARREARRKAKEKRAKPAKRAARPREVGGREALRILSTRARKRLHLS